MPTHRHAKTTLMKFPSGNEFPFRNDHAGVTPGLHPADKWQSSAEPGELVLFRNYLMHAVPHNPAPRPITMAFNAVPKQLDEGGYRVTSGG